MEDIEAHMEVASTKAFTEASTKASTEVFPRKLPRIRKLLRKHFHGILGFSSMEASGSFHGRSEAQRLPRKLASTKIWKPHPRNFFVLLPWKLPQLPRNLSDFHGSSHEYICIVHCCASSRAYHL